MSDEMKIQKLYYRATFFLSDDRFIFFINARSQLVSYLTRYRISCEIFDNFFELRETHFLHVPEFNPKLDVLLTREFSRHQLFTQ